MSNENTTPIVSVNPETANACTNSINTVTEIINGSIGAVARIFHEHVGDAGTADFYNESATAVASWLHMYTSEVYAATTEFIHHDGAAPHLQPEPRPGASYFYFDSFDKLLSKFKDATHISVKREGPTLFVQFELDKEVGETVESRPSLFSTKFKVVQDHGMLKLRGRSVEVKTPTKKFHLIFTWEGDEFGWATASICPGEPSPLPNTEGLKEGDIITFLEASDRKFCHVISDDTVDPYTV